MDIVQDDHVRNELVVFDNLALFVPNVFGNDTFAPKKQPFDEAVEFLALVGSGVNGTTQFRVVDVLEQEHGPMYPAELAERVVELVLAASRA